MRCAEQRQGSADRQRTLCFWAAAIGVAVLPFGGAATSGPYHPWTYFDSKQRAALRDGSTIATTFTKGPELTLVVAGRTDISRERFLAWAGQYELIQASSLTSAAGQFSDPPNIDDVAQLTLNADDLNDLHRCRPSACGMKLSADEIAQVRTDIRSAGEQWRQAATETFRKILVARATSFRALGPEAMLPYDDHRKRTLPWEELAGVLAGPERVLLRHEPRREMGSRLFWTKNVADGAREMISITDVTLSSCGGQLAIVSSQVYASHYLDASVSYTLLTRDEHDQYLVYIRRTRIDLFRGLFGGLVRSILERRVRADAPRLFNEVRHRLQTSEPPAGAVSARGG